MKTIDLKTGNGMIATDEGGDDVFFNFTAIPGEGYRTLGAGTLVQFEIVSNPFGITARNVQRVK
ncbi:cold shock domain-containing protein [Tolypothrix sp. FACHB-123]|nr:cold shock domain-containing protein [Tolypothrix sp. FACHB-123]